MQIDDSFRAAYRRLEQRMKALAEADGDVFLPNPEPQGPVGCILICMEPSLGRWARTLDQARSKVKAGFRNFLPSDETSILHFCIRRYLCEPGDQYHVTDFSKGAMLTARAGLARERRYDKWYSLLQEEIELVATANARMVTVGKAVSQRLKRKAFRRHFTPVIHYSGQAGRARAQGILGREDDFQAFERSVSHSDLVVAAQQVLTSACVPAAIREDTLMRLNRFALTTSRKQLIFNYKIAFESMRTKWREDANEVMRRISLIGWDTSWHLISNYDSDELWGAMSFSLNRFCLWKYTATWTASTPSQLRRSLAFQVVLPFSQFLHRLGPSAWSRIMWEPSTMRLAQSFCRQALTPQRFRPTAVSTTSRQPSSYFLISVWGGADYLSPALQMTNKRFGLNSHGAIATHSGSPFRIA
jgi:hypothetical protein